MAVQVDGEPKMPPAASEEPCVEGQEPDKMTMSQRIYLEARNFESSKGSTDDFLKKEIGKIAA